MANENYLRSNDNIVKGDELWMFLCENPGAGVTGASTPMPIAFSTQHSLNWSMSTNSVSSKDHGNTSYTVPGEATWTVSTEALFSLKTADGTTGTNQGATFETLMDLKDKAEGVIVQFGTISNYDLKGIVNVDVTDTRQENGWELDTPYWEGIGIINSVQASGGHGDSATMSIEIQGVGPLTKMTGQTGQSGQSGQTG